MAQTPNERLVELISMSGYSYENFARYAKISIATVEKYVNPKHEIRVALIRKLREVIPVNPAWLMEGVEPVFTQSHFEWPATVPKHKKINHLYQPDLLKKQQEWAEQKKSRELIRKQEQAQRKQAEQKRKLEEKERKREERARYNEALALMKAQQKQAELKRKLEEQERKKEERARKKEARAQEKAERARSKKALEQARYELKLFEKAQLHEEDDKKYIREVKSFGFKKPILDVSEIRLVNRIVEERERLGISMADWANEIYVTEDFQQQFEAGNVVPIVAYLEAVARTFPVDCYFLLTGRRQGE